MHAQPAPDLIPTPGAIKDRGMPSDPSDLARLLGQQLRTAREKAGLSRAEAADLAGVTETRWGQMERGSTANLNKLQAACRAIGAVLRVSVEVPSEDE